MFNDRFTYLRRHAGAFRVRVVFSSALVTFACALACAPISAAVPTKERDALLDLYNKLQGTSWRSSTNWSGSSGSECTWSGVQCNSDETSVIGLDLRSNQLSGTIPSSLANLSNLEDLNLSGNQLTGTIPAFLSSLAKLRRFDLSSNHLTGVLPTLFGSRATLQVLNVSGNQLSGSIPSALARLTNLKELSLSGNKITSSIPRELGALTNLEVLALSHNQLDGAIPAELGKLSKLTVLNLSSNKLQGTIPSALGALAELESLYLHDNRLTGSIPPELGGLAHLQQIILSGNRLSGTIPSSLEGLKDLVYLDFADNQLSGAIPSSLGSLTNLYVLDLSDNMLSGGIPSSLGNLSALVMLNLTANMLSGSVPSSVATLSCLSSFSIAYNGLKADDAEVRGFLDLAQPGWDNTQTVAPGRVAVASAPENQVVISWSAIAYAADSGRYEVWSSTTRGGPYTLSGLTFDKSETSLVLKDLDDGTYYFVVITTSDANMHNQNAVTSESSDEVSVELIPRSTVNLSIGVGGAAAISARWTNSTTALDGYASVTVDSGATPYATAVFRYRQNGITVGETAVPASAPTKSAAVFIDCRKGATIPSSTGTVDISTGLAVVNTGAEAAEVTAVLRDLDGRILSWGTGRLAKGGHVAVYFEQLEEIFAGFSVPSSFALSTGFGTVELTSSQPLSVLALRLTTNQRGETLITSTATADRAAQPAGTQAYFPQFVDGGGDTTTVFLMNTSSRPVSGTLEVYSSDGSPLTVKQLNGPSASSFPYSIPAEGAYVFQSEASPGVARVGWVRITPNSGSTTPTGEGLIQHSESGVLIAESGIAPATPTTHARIYVEISDTHDTGLALVNPAAEPAQQIRLSAYQLDGSTPAGIRPEPITLGALSHFADYVSQRIAGLPSNFHGVVDITSDSPFVAMTVRSLINERGEFLFTTFPVADMNQPAPSPIVIPQIVDGGGFTTEIILLSPGASSVATVSFFGDAGAPISLTVDR